MSFCFSRKLAWVVLASICVSSAAWSGTCDQTGILVTAHGVSSHHGFSHADEWEKTVSKLVTEAALRLPFPVTVAFGMWSRENFEKGLQELSDAGACRVRIVPFFISSHSVVIEAQRYQFGLRETNPLPFDPGRVQIPPSVVQVEYGGGLDDHALLSEILRDRAVGVSQTPGIEEVVLVAHGPVEPEEDLLWHQDLMAHASRIQRQLQDKGQFAAIHALTLQDDAPEEVRNEKTRQLRKLVQAIRERSHTALVVPVLLARGGIEKGLLERLEGLEFSYQEKMLAPDSRLADWIVDQASRP